MWWFDFGWRCATMRVSVTITRVRLRHPRIAYLGKGLIELTAGRIVITVSGSEQKPVSLLSVVFVNSEYFGIPE